LCSCPHLISLPISRRLSADGAPPFRNIGFGGFGTIRASQNSYLLEPGYLACFALKTP